MTNKSKRIPSHVLKDLIRQRPEPETMIGVTQRYIDSENTFMVSLRSLVPGWYHWDQIEELRLYRPSQNDKLVFRVTVKESAQPYDRPTGIVNYFLNVDENGLAEYFPEATDDYYRETKEAFDEFKNSLKKEK